MRAWIDRVALAARDLTVTDIEAALNRENLELPAGKIQSKDRDFQVRIGRNYQTDEQFRDLVLAQGKDGHLIRLGEVARVQVGPRENQRWFRTNGKTTTGVGIIKQSTANVVEVLDAVKAEVERVNRDLPTVVLVSVFAPVAFLKDSIGRIFAELAVTIAAAVTFSAVLALSLSPMMCSKLLRRSGDNRLTHKLDQGFEWLSNRYQNLLRASL